MVNTVKNFLIIPNNLQQMFLKLLQKVKFKKQQKQLVILLVIKCLTELVTVTNENDKERYISPEKIQEIIDNLRLK